MTTSEQPELLEVEYRRPSWIQPPPDMPGVVPIELVLAAPRSGRSG